MDASLDHAGGPTDLHPAERPSLPTRSLRIRRVGRRLWRWMWPRGHRELDGFPLIHRATLRHRATLSPLRWALRWLVSGAVGLIVSAPFGIVAVQCVEFPSHAASFESWVGSAIAVLGLVGIGAVVFLAVSRRCVNWFFGRQLRRVLLHAGRCYGCGYSLLARPSNERSAPGTSDGACSCPECGQVNELDGELAECVLSNPVAAERLAHRAAREARMGRAIHWLVGLAGGGGALGVLALVVAWHVVCVNHRELRRLRPSPAAYAALRADGQRPDERLLPVADAAKSVCSTIEELAEAPLAAFFSGPRSRTDKEVAEFGPFNLYWWLESEEDQRLTGQPALKPEEIRELVISVCDALRDGGALEQIASVADTRRPLTSVTGELSPHWEALPWRVGTLIDLTTLLSGHAIRMRDEQGLLSTLTARQGLLRLRCGLAVPNHPTIRRQKEDLLTDVLFAATVATRPETLDALGQILDRAHQPGDAETLAGAFYLDILNMNTAYLQPVPFGGAWDRWLTEAWQERRLTGEQLDAAQLRRIAEDWKRQAGNWLGAPASERRPIRSLSTGTSFDGFLRVFDERMMQSERAPEAITLARACIACRRFQLRTARLPDTWTECQSAQTGCLGPLSAGKVIAIEATDPTTDRFGRSFRACVVQRKLGQPSSGGWNVEIKVLLVEGGAGKLDHDSNHPSLVVEPSR